MVPILGEKKYSLCTHHNFKHCVISIYAMKKQTIYMK